MRQRRQCLSGQQRVAQLEQRVGTASEAGVQLGTEGAELDKWGRWLGHGRGA
jgi:hypothetical protein